MFLRKYELENLEEIVPNLTKQERHLMTFFLNNKDKIIDKDRLAMIMKMTDDDFSLWAIYQAISRLKRKIAPKYRIKVLKNTGYVLDSNSLRR